MVNRDDIISIKLRMTLYLREVRYNPSRNFQLRKSRIYFITATDYYCSENKLLLTPYVRCGKYGYEIACNKENYAKPATI